MLSSSDAEFVRNNADLPGLSILLDTDAFVTQLNDVLPKLHVISGQANYVRYKPGTNALVAYQLQTEQGTTCVYAIAYASGPHLKLTKARQKSWKVGLLGIGCLIFDDLLMVVCEFPNDRRLRTLYQLANNETQRKLLQQIISNSSRSAYLAVTPLRYKPERRYVARIEIDEKQYLFKMYSEGTYNQALHNNRAFNSGSCLRIPQFIGHTAHHHSLVMEWLPGTTLETALQNKATGPHTIWTIGAALAELHRQSPKLPYHYTGKIESNALHTAANTIGTIAPELANKAWCLVEQLERTYMRTGGQPESIHGDFSADQVLLLDQREQTDKWSDAVALLDFDRAGYGEPAIDFGSFAAQLYTWMLEENITSDELNEIMTMLVSGYQAVAKSAPDPHQIQWYTAARLLRLAPEAFRHRSVPDWLTHIEKILHVAKEIAPNA